MTVPTPETDFSYSGDPTFSEKDECRFLTQDTDPVMPLLNDTEYAYLLDKWMPLYGSVTYVAAVACAIISRKFASVVSVSADGVSVSTADLSQRYRELAGVLRDEYAAEGAAEGSPTIENLLAGFEWDASIEPLEFGMHIHDNPAAGRQNYGGTRGGPRFNYDTHSWD